MKDDRYYVVTIDNTCIQFECDQKCLVFSYEKTSKQLTLIAFDNSTKIDKNV